MTDQKTKAYREWWVIDDQGDSFIFSLKEDAFSYKTDVDAHFKINQEIIHVVEAQAVKELEAALETKERRWQEDNAFKKDVREKLEAELDDAKSNWEHFADLTKELTQENERLREALMVIGSSDFIEGEYYGSFTKYRKMLVDQIADLALKKGDE